MSFRLVAAVLKSTVHTGASVETWSLMRMNSMPSHLQANEHAQQLVSPGVAVSRYGAATVHLLRYLPDTLSVCTP